MLKGLWGRGRVRNLRKIVQFKAIALAGCIGIFLPFCAPATAQIVDAPVSDETRQDPTQQTTDQQDTDAEAQPQQPEPLEPPLGLRPTLDELRAAEERARQAGARLPQVDGDLRRPLEPEPIQDGVIDLQERRDAPEGAEAKGLDTRNRADYEAFAEPPAGYDPEEFQIPDETVAEQDIEPDDDPLLLQIEDLGTASRRLDRRLERLFEETPFDPIGVRIGSFVFFPELEMAGRWTSNVFSSPNALSDRAFELTPQGRLASDWNNHALEFRAQGLFSFFDEFDSENNRGYELESRGRLDVTRRTNFQAQIQRGVTQESRSAIDANAAGERTTVKVDEANLAFNHRFNRLRVRLRGAVEDSDYSAVLTPTGLASNADRNFTETRQSVRASWEFKPTLTVFTEAELIQRDFNTVAFSDQIGRDSDGGRYVVGIDFGTTSQILRGEISLGYGIQNLRASQFDDVDTLLFDASLIYRFNALTSFLLTARSDIVETVTDNSPAVVEHSVGFGVRHAFQHRLIGRAGATFNKREFANIGIDENEWVINAGLEYYFNRYALTFVEYEHTDFKSGFPDSDFVDDTFRLGLKLQR